MMNLKPILALLFFCVATVSGAQEQEAVLKQYDIFKEGDLYYRTLDEGLTTAAEVEVRYLESFPLDLSDFGYATLCSNHPFELPAGVQAGVVKSATDHQVQIQYLYQGGEVVPAHTPLILKGAPQQYPLQQTVLQLPVERVTENLLRCDLGLISRINLRPCRFFDYFCKTPEKRPFQVFFDETP